MQTHEFPDPEGLDMDELLDAYHDLLWETCREGVHWARHYGLKSQALEGEAEVDVWTPAGTMTVLERYVEQQTGATIDVPKFHDDRWLVQLVAVLNALDADVERVMQGGIREEVEEVYLGLREIKNGG